MVESLFSLLVLFSSKCIFQNLSSGKLVALYLVIILDFFGFATGAIILVEFESRCLSIGMVWLMILCDNYVGWCQSPNNVMVRSFSCLFVACGCYRICYMCGPLFPTMPPKKLMCCKHSEGSSMQCQLGVKLFARDFIATYFIVDLHKRRREIHKLGTQAGVER